MYPETSSASSALQIVRDQNTIFGYFIDCGTEKYFQFSGRARRKEYWSYNLFAFILSMILSVTFDIGGISPVASTLLLWIMFFPAGISVTVRRLHDTGRSAWNLLWSFLPFVGFIIIFVFTVLPSEKGANRYGPQPAPE